VLREEKLINTRGKPCKKKTNKNWSTLFPKDLQHGEVCLAPTGATNIKRTSKMLLYPSLTHLTIYK
jgi:hypothetical protein